MAKWTVKRVFRTAIFASAIGAAGLHASPAAAQSDLLGGGGGGGAATSAGNISIRDFQLMGALCPQREATRVMLTPAVTGVSNARINVAFPTTNGARSRPLQVNGPGTRTATCTVAVSLVPTSGRRVAFSILSGRENVRFINRSGQGQLAVRSQFRVGNETSGVATRTLPAATQDTPMELTFNNVNLDSMTTGTILFVVALEIQLNNTGNDAAVRIEGANFSFQVRDAGSGQNLLPDDVPTAPAPAPAAGSSLLDPAAGTPGSFGTPGGFGGESGSVPPSRG